MPKSFIPEKYRIKAIVTQAIHLLYRQKISVIRPGDDIGYEKQSMEANQ